MIKGTHYIGYKLKGLSHSVQMFKMNDTTYRNVF